MLWHKVQGAGGASGPVFTATISTNQQELNLATYATGQGWNGTDRAEITIASGVYVWSDDTATPALTTGSFPGGLTLIVNGYIMGKGGAGADTGSGGENGGPAISLGTDATIRGGTNGYIGGGGGGGGTAEGASFTVTGGGGAGGGDSLDEFGDVSATGGSVGNSGANGSVSGGSGPNAGSGGGAGGGGAGL